MHNHQLQARESRLLLANSRKTCIRQRVVPGTGVPGVDDCHERTCTIRPRLRECDRKTYGPAHMLA